MPRAVAGAHRSTAPRVAAFDRFRQLSLPQAAWTTVTAICVIAAVLLLLNGYDGYSAVLLFVALSAAVNLLP